MRLTPLLLCLASGLRTVTAVANTTSALAQLSVLSPCSLSCVTIKIPVVGCELLDINCQCASNRLLDITAACLYANCTLEETLDTAKVTAEVCERPSQSKNSMLHIMTYVCATITNGSVLARFLVRWLLRQQIRLDDVFIVLAIISAAIFTYFGVLFEKNGFGTHIYDVDSKVVPDLLYWLFVCEPLYILTIGMVKISILCFYLNVFPRKSFKIATIIVLGFVVACITTFTLATVFQCTPVRRAWQLDLPGKCVNYNAFSWSNAVLNIVQDILIVVLPIRELRSLQISSKKKIGLYAMFSVGSFVFITGIIRLYTLKNFGLTADPTWNNVPTIFWSTLETTAAVFCACMPSMRAGLVRLFPKVFGSTSIFESSRGSSNWGSKVSSAKRGPRVRSISRDLNTTASETEIELDTKQGGRFIRIDDATGSEVALRGEDTGRKQNLRFDSEEERPPLPRKDDYI
ncbi:Satratoxin biosynthesis SC1 cluster protein [Lachnellula suecica]|uniref:Satratoxin biosynthesis SC1 cluster protein n=1 Tax=Lachnellula suecica TaxID=602035 RepID=A0A8T9CAT8_9HELO|nr:Satratoxin biosynthesis SC1 cluster protein [Lachnellula suecica]